VEPRTPEVRSVAEGLFVLISNHVLTHCLFIQRMAFKSCYLHFEGWKKRIEKIIKSLNMTAFFFYAVIDCSCKYVLLFEYFAWKRWKEKPPKPPKLVSSFKRASFSTVNVCYSGQHLFLFLVLLKKHIFVSKLWLRFSTCQAGKQPPACKGQTFSPDPW